MPTIRVAAPSDAAQLAAFAERTFRDTFAADNTPSDMELHCAQSYSEALQRAELENPEVTTLFCEDGERLAGIVQLHSIAGSDGGLEPEIRRFYVDTPWHGTGMARQLMEHAIGLAELAAARRVWLGVWEQNPRAIAFYRKCGFVEDGTAVFMVGTDPQRDVIMSLTLPR